MAVWADGCVDRPQVRRLETEEQSGGRTQRALFLAWTLHLACLTGMRKKASHGFIAWQCMTEHVPIHVVVHLSSMCISALSPARQVSSDEQDWHENVERWG